MLLPLRAGLNLHAQQLPHAWVTVVLEDLLSVEPSTAALWPRPAFGDWSGAGPRFTVLRSESTLGVEVLGGDEEGRRWNHCAFALRARRSADR